jgi:hypothetical protein
LNALGLREITLAASVHPAAAGSNSQKERLIKSIFDPAKRGLGALSAPTSCLTVKAIQLIFDTRQLKITKFLVYWNYWKFKGQIVKVLAEC